MISTQVLSLSLLFRRWQCHSFVGIARGVAIIIVPLPTRQNQSHAMFKIINFIMRPLPAAAERPAQLPFLFFYTYFGT